MNYYSYKGNYPVTFDDIPDRIRLSNGFTRTDKKSFTEEELEDAGYIKVSAPPENQDVKTFVDWDRNTLSWIIREHDYQEKAKEVQNKMTKILENFQWRIERYERETRLNIDKTDDATLLELYIKELLEIPKQKDYPYLVKWPYEIGSASDRLNGNVR